MQIYVHQNGQQTGPFTEEEIRAQLAAGTLARQDLVWWDGQPGWVSLEATHLATEVAISTPPAVEKVAPITVTSPITPAADISAIQAPARTSGLAIGSLVCGILGFFTCLPSIIAVVLGHISLREIKRTPGLGGRGVGLAGLVLGYVGMAIFVAFVSLGVLLELGKAIKRDEMLKRDQAELAAREQAERARQQATTNAAPGQ